MNFEYFKGVGRCGMNGAVCQLVVRSESDQKFGKKTPEPGRQKPTSTPESPQTKDKHLNFIHYYYQI